MNFCNKHQSQFEFDAECKYCTGRNKRGDWPHDSEQLTFEVLDQAEEPKSKGKKNDAGKPDLSLIPLIAQEEEAVALMVGEKEYGRYNYCEGLSASRQVAALLRHAAKWFNGEERDPITGQHHLGSVKANASMILRQMELGTLIDDRYKGGK